MAITPLPPVPQRTDAPSVFVPKADAFLGALPQFQAEANALQTDVNSNQVLATNAASLATAQASVATNAAAAAASSAGATLWVSGTTYTIGQKVISPANTLTYIRRTNGAGTTDPSVDTTNWNPAVPGISKFVTATASTTYTASTIGYITTSMTSAGQSITLPAANTLSIGIELVIIDNTKGNYPVGVRDNTGVLLISVGVGGYLTLALKDNSTVAGVWGFEGDNLEPGLVTFSTQFSSTYTQTAYNQFVSFDDNTSLHFASLTSGGFAAMVCDNLGKVVSTPVAISTTASVIPVAAYKISSTSAIVFYGTNAAGNSSCVVVSLTGSSPSYGLSVGTPQTNATDMQRAWGAENSVGAQKIAQLTPTLYVIAYTDSSSGVTGAVAVSVSGTSVTIGTPVTVQASSSTTGSQWIVPLTATTALMFYASSGNLRAVVVTVTGTVVTFGTPVDNGTTGTGTSNPWSYCQLTPTKAVVMMVDGGGSCILRIASTSGTTVTWSAPLTLTGGSINACIYTGNNATRFNPHLTPLSSTDILTWFINSDGSSTVLIVTENSGTLSAGSILYSSFKNSSIQDVLVLPSSSSEFVAMSSGTSTLNGRKLTPHSISGTSVTYGNVSPYTAETDPNAIQTGSSAFLKLSSGYYCTINNVVGLSVFSSNGVNISKRGIVQLPTIVGSGNNKIAASSNRLVLLNPSINTISSTGANLLVLTNVEIAK